MKIKRLRKAAALLLALLLTVTSFTGTVSAMGTDVDIDLTELQSTSIAEKATFVNSNGAVIDSSDEYSKVTVEGSMEKGQTVTLTCDFDKDSGCYSFLGWFDGDTLISSEQTASVIFGSNENITPKILSKNVLTSASGFESVAAGNVKADIAANTEGLYMYNSSKDTYTLVPTGPAPSGHTWGMFTNFAYPTHKLVDGEYVEIEGAYKKGSYNGDTLFPIKAIHGEYQHTYFTDYSTDSSLTSTVTVTPHTGNVMIGMGQMYRSGVKELTGLKANTDYVLNIWVYQANPCGFIKSAVVTDHYDGIQTNGLIAFADDCNVLGASNYSSDTQVYGEWTKLTVNFSTADKTTAYLHLSQNGLGTDGNKGMIFMDDLTVVESDTEIITGKELAEDGIANTQSVVTVSGNSAALNYTGSGLEFTVRADGTVKATITANVYNTAWDLRLALYMNGERQEDIILTSGTHEVVLASNLDKGKYTFKIERMTENLIGQILFDNIMFGGETLTPPAAKELHIDYYGDSITAGWGTTYYNAANVTNHYAYQDGTITYAALTAANLNADYNAFAFSGIGIAVTGSNDGKGTSTMTNKYPDLPKNTNADYVVINLGTNDASKYASAGLTEQQVKDAYLAFAQAVRADYGEDTPIIFAYGMMTDNANGFVSYAVDAMKAAGDENIYSVKLPKGTSGGVGHPNAAEQATAAEVLTAFIRKLSSTLAGDVNDDGSVDLSDVVLLAQKVAGWDVTVNEAVANINGKGNTDLSDVVTLAQYVAGWNDIVMSGDIYSTYNACEHTLKEIESNLKLNSRAAFDGDLLRMEWSYSGFTIEGQFSGDIILTDIDVTKELLAYATIDGDLENAVQLIVNDGDLTIVKDLKPGFHTIQFFKATEASGAQMTAGGIKYNGAIFERPADKELKIQVIGDSITSASGLYTTDVEPNALYRNDISKGYAVKVADHFDADLSIVSVSGGTVCTKTPSMQDYYQKAQYSKDGAYDFSTETEPDIVIIALGTNDTPTYNTNGVPSENVGILKQGITDMLTLVRAKNPNATIIWAYGMMATNIASVYKETVEAFGETDGNTYYTLINRNDCTGQSGHPTPAGHTANAKEYINFIENNILTD